MIKKIIGKIFMFEEIIKLKLNKYRIYKVKYEIILGVLIVKIWYYM